MLSSKTIWLSVVLLAIIVCLVPSDGAAQTGSSPSPFGAGLDSIVTPQMFGAIADGAHHPIKQADIETNAEKWVGKYAVGDEWDYVGLQEAIYSSFNNGTLKPNASNARLNKLLYLPPGNYLVNKSPTITLVHGGTIQGAGRLVTTVTSTFAGPAFQTNGCWYTQFTGIQFSGGVAYEGAVFELDGNYDGTNKQGVQGNTFKDCFFHANGIVKSAFALVRRGGNRAQGSENLFLNCHFQSATFAGVYVTGYNALQNTFVGGNIQNCTNGIYVQAGSINVDSMGFQNGFQSQIDHGGFDVVFRNSADDHSSVKNCRTESACLLSAGNKHYVVLDNNDIVNGPPNGDWRPGSEYKQGAITRGLTGGNGNGHLHIAMAAGTSGGREPQWPANAFVTTGTIAADSDILSIGDAAVKKESAKHFGVIVNGAGIGGAALFSTLQNLTDGKWQLADKAATGAENAIVRIGPLVADGGIAWMHYEYDEVRTDVTASITNNTFKWGRALFGGGEIANNSFARADAFPLLTASNASADPRFLLVNNHVTTNGGWNTGRLPATFVRGK